MKKWVANIVTKVALQSTYRHWKHGAVLYKGGRILGRGNNLLKPKCPQDNKYSTHAEVAAIKNAGKNAKGSTLYSARVTAHHLGNAKPCAACELFIKLAGIKKIVYSIDANTWGICEI